MRWWLFHWKTSSGLHHTSKRITPRCARIFSRSSTSMMPISISSSRGLKASKVLLEGWVHHPLLWALFWPLQKYGIDVWAFFGARNIFNPEIYSSDFLTPLLEIVNGIIQAFPIDIHRGLSRYITGPCEKQSAKNHLTEYCAVWLNHVWPLWTSGQWLKWDLTNMVDRHIVDSEVSSRSAMVMAHSLSQPHSLSQSKENFCNLYFMA